MTTNTPETQEQRQTAVASSDLLAACPHCRKTTEDKDPHTEQRAVIATKYTVTNACVVQCNWCGLSGPIFGTIDEAIEAWNRLPRNEANICELIDRATLAETHVAALQKEITAMKRKKADMSFMSDALNSGDGTYKP